MLEDCWLVFTSKQQCEALILRLCKKQPNLCDRLGVPLPLINGQWAQCVDGCWDFLTKKERKLVVSFANLKNKVVIA